MSIITAADLNHVTVKLCIVVVNQSNTFHKRFGKELEM